MLHELACVLGQDFTVMDGARGPVEIVPVVLGAADERREGDLLAVGVGEDVLNIAVVVGLDGHGLVLDELLAGGEFLEDLVFGLRGDGARRLAAARVLKEEGLGVGAKALEEAEQAALADTEDFLEVPAGKLGLEVACEQFAELRIGEVLV